jgi:hypothetical protein
MENSMETPLKKLEMYLPYDPAIPLLGIYLKNVSQVTMETAKMPHY